MPTSIKQSFQHSDSMEQIELRAVLATVLADFTALRSAFNTLVTKLNTDHGAQNTVNNTHRAKMDTDFADVTNASVDYASSGVSALDANYAAASALTLTD